MYIAQFVLVKHEGLVKKGQVTEIFPEDLQIKLEDGTLIMRKFWEIRNAPYDNEKEIY